MKRIFLYTRDVQKTEVLESICREQQIELCFLKGSDVNRTVAAICGVAMKAEAEHSQAPVLFALPELLLFYGLDDKSLDRFLDAYNASGLEKILRKAVVTPTNLGWTLYELSEQLGKEISM